MHIACLGVNNEAVLIFIGTASLLFAAHHKILQNYLYGRPNLLFEDQLYVLTFKGLQACFVHHS